MSMSFEEGTLLSTATLRRIVHHRAPIFPRGQEQSPLVSDVPWALPAGFARSDLKMSVTSGSLTSHTQLHYSPSLKGYRDVPTPGSGPRSVPRPHPVSPSPKALTGVRHLLQLWGRLYEACLRVNTTKLTPLGGAETPQSRQSSEDALTARFILAGL